MEILTATNVRDFRVRGNYFSWRSLLSRRDLHSSKKQSIGPNQPGYSPPAVDFELQDGTTSSVVVSESDIPLLYDDDIEKAKRYLFWIVEARRGDLQAVTELRSAAQEYSFEEAKQSPTLRKPFRGSLYQLSVLLRANHQSKSVHTSKAVPTRLSGARICRVDCAGLRRSRSAS